MRFVALTRGGCKSCSVGLAIVQTPAMPRPTLVCRGERTGARTSASLTRPAVAPEQASLQASGIAARASGSRGVTPTRRRSPRATLHSPGSTRPTRSEGEGRAPSEATRGARRQSRNVGTPGPPGRTGWRAHPASKPGSPHAPLQRRASRTSGAAATRARAETRTRSGRPYDASRATAGSRGSPAQASSSAKRPRHSGREPDLGALLLEPAAEQQQPALQVVLPLRQLERLVEPQLAVRELRASRRLVRRQQPPQDPRGQAADQVLAVDEDRLVRGVVDDLAPRSPPRGRAAPGADGAGARGRRVRLGSASTSTAPAAACSGSRSRGSCRAARSRSCPPRGSGRAPRSPAPARRPARRAPAAARRAGSAGSRSPGSGIDGRGCAARALGLPVHREGVEHPAHAAPRCGSACAPRPRRRRCPRRCAPRRRRRSPGSRAWRS